MDAPLLATTMLAQSTTPRNLSPSETDQFLKTYSVWFAVVLVLLVLALVGLKQARRLTLKDRSEDANLWDLDKLRALRDSGELTIQEYDTLRRAAIERAMRPNPTAPLQPPPSRDPPMPPGTAAL